MCSLQEKRGRLSGGCFGGTGLQGKADSVLPNPPIQQPSLLSELVFSFLGLLRQIATNLEAEQEVYSLTVLEAEILKAGVSGVGPSFLKALRENPGLFRGFVCPLVYTCTIPVSASIITWYSPLRLRVLFHLC